MAFTSCFIRYPHLRALAQNVSLALDMLERCIRGGGKILLCGNGGSASDCEHIAGELMKGFLLPRHLSAAQQRALVDNDAEELCGILQQAIPAIPLVAGVALPTAFANDSGGKYTFAQQVLALGRRGDVLWAISTSGSSANVIFALRVARAFGLKTLGLTARDGGQMAALCDVELRVPATETAYAQELHLPLYHEVCAELERRFFDSVENL